MKKLIIKIFRRIGLAGRIVILRNGALKEWGWFRTFDTGRSEDRYGNPLAWYTYAFLYFLEPRLRPDFTVFEYGCGNSTFWFAPRVGRVFSVEHHPDWFRYIDRRRPANAQIALAESKEAYLAQVQAYGTRYDLIVVDGIHRNECLARAPEALSDRGVIILDNSERPDYAAAIADLLAKGFRRLDFYGMAPVTPLPGTTTVFYRAGNCLGI